MKVHELSTLLPVEVTGLGRGYALFVEVENHDHWWTVILDTGALVTVTQDRLRASDSYTHRRGISDQRMKAIVGRKR